MEFINLHDLIFNKHGLIIQQSFDLYRHATFSVSVGIPAMGNFETK